MAGLQSFRRERWKLERVLFRVRPPEKRYLDQVFTGRTNELEECRIAVYEAPSNLLVNGLFGVGKTIFIQELRRQLGDQYGGDILSVYETLDTGTADLLTTILRGLARALRDEQEEAHNLDAVLSGLEISNEQTRGLSGEFEVGIPGVVVAKAVPKKGDKVIHTVKGVTNSSYHIRRLIERAVEHKPNRRLVVAVDDLDKRDPDTIRQSLVEARTTLHQECSFILTGHPLGVLRDAYATAGGIFDRQIDLPLFSIKDLEEMMRNYLTVGRVKKANVSPLTPFTAEAANAITERACGNPRVLNAICHHILGEAAKRRLPEIGLPELESCWETIASDLRRGIQPDLRSLLEVLLEYPEGITPTNIPDEIFFRLDVDSYGELLLRVNEAMRSDWAISLEDKVVVHPRVLGFSQAGELPGPPTKD